jgi:hypothetical protein
MEVSMPSRLSIALVTISISLHLVSGCTPDIDSGVDPQRQLVPQTGVERAISAAPG